MCCDARELCKHTKADRAGAGFQGTQGKPTQNTTSDNVSYVRFGPRFPQGFQAFRLELTSAWSVRRFAMRDSMVVLSCRVAPASIVAIELRERVA